MMTKGNTEKKRKVNPYNVKSESPQKIDDWKRRSKIIILVGNDKQNTPWGYAFDNFYDGRNIIKSLSNKMGETTSIGNVDFKPFDNLTTKWVKSSELGKNLWVIRIDNSADCERKFPIEAHTAFANKIARGLIKGRSTKHFSLMSSTKNFPLKSKLNWTNASHLPMKIIQMKQFFKRPSQ